MLNSNNSNFEYIWASGIHLKPFITGIDVEFYLNQLLDTIVKIFHPQRSATIAEDQLILEKDNNTITIARYPIKIEKVNGNLNVTNFTINLVSDSIKTTAQLNANLIGSIKSISLDLEKHFQWLPACVLHFTTEVQNGIAYKINNSNYISRFYYQDKRPGICAAIYIDHDSNQIESLLQFTKHCSVNLHCLQVLDKSKINFLKLISLSKNCVRDYQMKLKISHEAELKRTESNGEQTQTNSSPNRGERSLNNKRKIQTVGQNEDSAHQSVKRAKM